MSNADLDKWCEWLKFQTFEDPKLEQMVGSCAEFCRRIHKRSNPCWLVLLGNRGTGKTHCAKRTFAYVVSQVSPDRAVECNPRISPVYWPELIERLRHEATRDAAARTLFAMCEWPVAFVDDVFAERDSTGMAAEKLNMVLSLRVGKWTIITGNKSLREIADVEPRVADRIVRERGNLCVTVDSASYAVRGAHA